MGIDSDRFERPKPCKLCGGLFEHWPGCPKADKETEDHEKTILGTEKRLADLERRVRDLEARIAALEQGA